MKSTCYNWTFTKEIIVVLLIALFSSGAMMAQGKVMINELMQSNVDFMMVNHDFPDSWVELYNGSDYTVAVKGYRIGPTNVYVDAYPLSSTTIDIKPGAHLTLYCDKTTDTPFHYNFNLDSGKGTLFLFDDTGTLIDSVAYGKMPAPNIAYGRVTDGSDEWQYELTPTPGTPNNSVGSDDVLPEPLFSVEGHLMTNGPETITITLPEGVPEDARIYLTTDGSEPTWESDNDTLFTLNIDRSTVVRAKLLSHKMLPIRSTTHSYIFHPRATNIPIVCIATDSAFLYSSEEGICSNENTYGAPNYQYDWRRPANFEYFNIQNGTTVFNQCGEMALAGGITRDRPQKSFKCYAKNRFGKKNFKGDFWRDKPEVTKVKSFILRNGGNNCKSGRIEDAALQKLFGTNIDEIDWQAYEPVIVYINGVYKGVYGFRERSQEDYVTSNYDIDDNEVGIATADAYIEPDAEPCFSDFYALYHRNNVTYEKMAEVINIDNFMNAFIAECYSSNTDYPRNNVSMWRQTGEGNKWHWILKDLDYVEEHDALWNMFKYMLGTDNPEDEEYEISHKSVIRKARYLYVKMMRFPEFSNRFITKYATYLGDFLRPDVCLPIVNEMAEEIRSEITPTFDVYNMSTPARHQYYVDLFCDYITQRPAIVYQQMADYFSLGNVIPVSILNDEEEDRSISVYDTPLRTGMFKGAWFTQFPLSIKVTNDSSAGWMMVVTHDDGNESTYVYNKAEIQPSLASCAPGDSVTFIAVDADAIMARKVMINELMQSNVDFMMVNHDFPDSWVELYNGSDYTVAVKGYRIGPTNVYVDAYPLSSTTIDIKPGAHLTLYCDKTTDTPFHYNFNLDSGKGTLFLFDDTGTLIDSVAYGKMPAPNIAYGRVTDGSDEWQYELTPTPGTPNNSVGSDDVLPEPLFSVEGHLMTNGPETITITLPEGVPEDARIYLTTDGSEPTWESDNDTLFTLNIDRSTVIRAKLLSHEMLPIRSTTHSYIFHPRNTKLPIVCIATDSTFLYSSEEGILSTDSTNGKPNYKYDWRRPANFEYFRTNDGTTVFNQCGEVAVGGGASRGAPQKSIKCYAKKRFGKKNFNGSFWRDKPKVTKVKSFMLRNGGNNCRTARINDAALQKFFGTNLEDIDWKAYEPAIVYINGTYKGIYGFRERSNEDYLTSNHDVEEEDVEMATGENYVYDNVKGTPDFNVFHALYNKADITYEELSEEMNIDNFMNVFIAECYGSNSNYPHNNIIIWKDTTNQSKWKWILKDLDAVYRHDASWNMFNYMLGTDDVQAQEYERSQKAVTVKARRLYERMMSFPEFRDSFIAVYATYLGDFLRPDICLPIVREMDDEIINEIAPTFAAYDNMSKLKTHKAYLELFCTYIVQRPDYVYQQMADYFQLGEPIKMCISSTKGGEISICDTPLRTGMFQGAWFTQFPLSIKVTNDSRAGWMMVVTHDDGNESTYVYNTAEIQPSLASCAPGDSVTFIATDADMVDGNIANNGNRTIASIYDATGKMIPTLHRGVNIILYADGTRRKILKE